ncbi:Ig domain-containing protein [Deinococcus rubellus]|uniref:Ig domain-containing protein n=1 Tax=Deinococcus rubellus TaxID=1889240 RepID=A0ABY5YLZ6_9DEIO|nr:putative Ig domain-containing protein [Deinococcus rubellus]UWX65362.1 putative Ig domain-containing protein [Deinococcus rubellus]
MNRLFPALVGATLLLSACGSGSTPSATPTSSRDLLGFSSASLGTAYVGESYSGSVAPLGGTGPYSVRLTSGTLPDGLKFSGGSSASISGTPTATGSATFSLEVVDANLSVKSQTFNLSVAELPPLDFVPKLPGGELRGETRIPLNVQGPRGVRAAHFTWVLPDNAQVTGVQSLGGTDAGRPIVFWKQSGHNLILDFGFRLPPKNASQVAMISLKPSNNQPLTLVPVASGSTSFVLALDGAGKVLREVKPQEVKPPNAAGPAIQQPVSPVPAASDSAAPAPQTSPDKAADPAKPADPVKAEPAPTAPAVPDPVAQPPGDTAPPVTGPSKADPVNPEPAIPDLAPTDPAPTDPVPVDPAPVKTDPATSGDGK